jgi:D-methionine transport system substrate-binding protein
MNRSKRVVFFATLALILAMTPAGLFAQAAQGQQKPVVLKVGATPIPHGDLLNLVKDDLLAKGIKLEIVELTDYVTPNILLADKQLDANFFQHTPYLVNFAAERKLSLEPAGDVFVATLCLYSRKYKKL